MPPPGRRRGADVTNRQYRSCRVAWAPPPRISARSWRSRFVPACCWQSAENLPRNLVFWIFLALITVALIASHGGYATRLRAASATGLAINCFLATSAAMLLLAFLLDHPHILTRRWTVADLVLTPAALGLVRGALGCRAAGPPPGPAGRTLIVCHESCPASLLSALNAQGYLGEKSRNHVSRGTAPPKRHPPPPARAGRQENPGHSVPVSSGAGPPHRRAGIAGRISRLAGADLDRLRHRRKLPQIPAERARHLPDRAGGGRFSSPRSISAKRLFDIILAVLLLFTCAPLLLLAAMLVKLSGPGR